MIISACLYIVWLVIGKPEHKSGNFLSHEPTCNFTCFHYALHCNLLGLLESLQESYRRVGISEPSDLYEVATGYACDGCYEPMFAGRSEFKFAYVIMPKVCGMMILCVLLVCIYVYLFIYLQSSLYCLVQ